MHIFWPDNLYLIYIIKSAVQKNLLETNFGAQFNRCKTHTQMDISDSKNGLSSSVPQLKIQTQYTGSKKTLQLRENFSLYKDNTCFFFQKKRNNKLEITWA